MPLKVFTQRNFVADFLLEKPTAYTENEKIAFEAPFGRLGATYAVHLRLIGKPIVDFLLVIIELFSLGAMVQALRANTDWKSPFLKGWVSLAQTFG